MNIFWLEAITNEEKTVTNWLDDGFYQGCGNFNHGKFSNNNVLNTFSHIVAWEKSHK